MSLYHTLINSIPSPFQRPPGSDCLSPPPGYQSGPGHDHLSPGSSPQPPKRCLLPQLPSTAFSPHTTRAGWHHFCSNPSSSLLGHSGHSLISPPTSLPCVLCSGDPSPTSLPLPQVPSSHLLGSLTTSRPWPRRAGSHCCVWGCGHSGRTTTYKTCRTAMARSG